MTFYPRKLNTGIFQRLSMAFIVGIILSVSVIVTTSNLQTSNAQNQSQSQSQGQPNPNAPLSFYLKFANNQSTSAAASQAAANGTGTKKFTITVNVQNGPNGKPIKLPISTVVPQNTQPQNLQFCANLAGGQQMCEPLSKSVPNIDLTSSSGAAAKTTPQAYKNSNENNIFNVLFKSLIQYADAQLISVNNTTLNIPITVIVPITLEIQNAQICASVASSGATSCQQVVLNPTQSAFTPVNVDLSNPTTPTVTTLSATIPSIQATTPGVTTSAGGANATSAGGANATSAGGANATSAGSQASQNPSNPTEKAQGNTPEQAQKKVPSNPTEKAQSNKNGGTEKSSSDKSKSNSGN